MNENKTLVPFSCSYTPQLPEILKKLNCSIALTTFQAGKVILLSASNNDQLIQLPRTFDTPMGIVFDQGKMAVATRDEITIFRISPELAKTYPRKENTYDGMIFPLASYFTGQIDAHDLHFEEGNLFAVNTQFSSIVKIDDNYNFTPIWKPNFITELAAGDRCHLNGMAFKNGELAFATALGSSNEPGKWRNQLPFSGILMDTKSNEILIDGLAMPHSPRMINDQLYFLESGIGAISVWNSSTREKEIIYQTDGFLRGMSFHKDYLFVGVSKLRNNSSSFSHLKEINKGSNAGVIVLHLPTKAFVGEMKYHSTVDEIYDVAILPDISRPNILNTRTKDYQLGLLTPDASYWAKRNFDQ